MVPSRSRKVVSRTGEHQPELENYSTQDIEHCQATDQGSEQRAEAVLSITSPVETIIFQPVINVEDRGTKHLCCGLRDKIDWGPEIIAKDKQDSQKETDFVI